MQNWEESLSSGWQLEQPQPRKGMWMLCGTSSVQRQTRSWLQSLQFRLAYVQYHIFFKFWPDTLSADSKKPIQLRTAHQHHRLMSISLTTEYSDGCPISLIALAFNIKDHCWSFDLMIHSQDQMYHDETWPHKLAFSPSGSANFASSKKSISSQDTRQTYNLLANGSVAGDLMTTKTSFQQYSVHLQTMPGVSTALIGRQAAQCINIAA